MENDEGRNLLVEEIYPLKALIATNRRREQLTGIENR